MHKEAIDENVRQINEIIGKELWYDFYVNSYIGDELSIYGGLSTSYPDMEITFKSVFLVSLPFMWKSDPTRGNILTLLKGEGDYEINKKFNVEYLHYNFKFIPDEYPDDFGCYISAKEISYRLLK